MDSTAVLYSCVPPITVYLTSRYNFVHAFLKLLHIQMQNQTNQSYMVNSKIFDNSGTNVL